MGFKQRIIIWYDMYHRDENEKPAYKLLIL